MWLERLVEIGDPIALKRKAEAYCVVEGIEQNFEEALKLFVEAGTSDPGDYNPDVLAEALFQAGNLHYTGEGTIPQNYEQALKYYKMSARLKYIKAYIQCGKLYYHGLGVEKNLSKAYHYYKVADEDTRNQALIYRLANDYFYGNNVGIDVDKALRCYEEAGKYKGHEYYFEANLKLAWIYELGENVKRDETKAEEYFKKLSPE